MDDASAGVSAQAINSKNMEKKQFIGGYLAPKIKVVEVKSRQVLCISVNMTVGGDPFSGNEETDWVD